MASLIDAFNDALSEDKALIKIFVYAIPIFLSANLYFTKNIVGSCLLAIPTIILILALMSNGICNIRANKQEILTFNIITLISVIIRLFIALLPITIIMILIGYLIVNFVKMPQDIPYSSLILPVIVWTIIFSIILTAYLSFSKTLNISEAYNLKVISESSIDVIINMMFLIPQLIIFNGLLVGAIWYIFFLLHLPLNNPIFLFYCSCILIFNVSALSSYFAQASYELIKGKDSEYQDNYYIKGAMNYNKKK